VPKERPAEPAARVNPLRRSLLREGRLVFFVILAVGVFYLATLRDGHEWGDDFALYILHARNLVEGIPYGQTGYIYNPAIPAIGPPTYPPVFPLLLAPVYKFFGLNLKAMKVEIILLFLALLWVLSKVFAGELPLSRRICLIALVGFSPVCWYYKDLTLSDLPFALFLYLALWRLKSCYRTAGVPRVTLLAVATAALALYLAYGTRSVGIVLATLQSVTLHSDASYAGILSGTRPQAGPVERALDWTLTWIEPAPRRLVNATRNLSLFLDNHYSKPFRVGLFLLCGVLALVGFVRRLRTRVSIFEIFSALYIGTYLFVQIPIELRYLLVVLPLFFFYIMTGLAVVEASLPGKWTSVPVVVVVSLMLITYVAAYSGEDFGPFQQGIGRKESLELFAYVKENSTPEDIFIFRKPRAFSLLTRRRASMYHWDAQDSALWAYFNQIGARFVIQGPPELDLHFWPEFLERNRDSLELVFSNADFKVYKLRETNRTR